MGDYDQSLKDCDEVLKRNPQHFGALSGYGLIYVKRGDLERALEYFQRALEINPNMESVEQTIELIRYKLERSPLLRSALEAGNWHILKANHLRAFAEREQPLLADLYVRHMMFALNIF